MAHLPGTDEQNKVSKLPPVLKVRSSYYRPVIDSLQLKFPAAGKRAANVPQLELKKAK